MVAADGLQFAYTLSRNSLVGRNGTQSLQNPFRNWTKGRGENTHFTEEIHQPSQLGSLQTGQILFLFVILDQAVKVAQEIRGRSVEQVEAL